MTPAEIAELRRLCEAATPGGWQEGRAGICDVVHFDGDDVRGVAWVNGEANRAFVIAARAALPAALDEVERLRKERDAHRTDAENLHREGGPARRELRLLKVEHAKATSDRDRLAAERERLRALETRLIAVTAECCGTRPEPAEESLTRLEANLRGYIRRAEKAEHARDQLVAHVRANKVALRPTQGKALRRLAADRDRLRALLAEAVGIAGLQDDEVTPEIRERLAAIAREGGLT